MCMHVHMYMLISHAFIQIMIVNQGNTEPQYRVIIVHELFEKMKSLQLKGQTENRITLYESKKTMNTP